jgi:hypothetical protein
MFKQNKQIKELMKEFTEFQLHKKQLNEKEEESELITNESDNDFLNYFPIIRNLFYTQSKELSMQAIHFIENVLKDESVIKKVRQYDNTNKNILRVSDSYRRLFNNNIMIGLVAIYIVPIMCLVNFGRNSRMGPYRYIFILPLAGFFNIFRQSISEFTLKRNSDFLLYLIEKNYDRDDPIYKNYKIFMDSNNLIFRKIYKNQLRV